MKPTARLPAHIADQRFHDVAQRIPYHLTFNGCGALFDLHQEIEFRLGDNRQIDQFQFYTQIIFLLYIGQFYLAFGDDKI